MTLKLCQLIALMVLPVMVCRAAPRAAFVVGNCGYTSFAKLDNPKQDAAEMSRVLAALGFAVTRADDLTAADLKTRLASFSTAHPDAGEIVFYFSGHGLQVHGENYLTGTDSALDLTKREAELKKILSGEDLTRQLETETRREADRTMLSLTSLADTLEKTGQKKAVRVVILDSCRDNPAGTKSVLGSKGFTRVEVPGGMLIAFAAKEGTTAAQTAVGKPSLYTGELLKVITRPGLTAEQVFKKTRAAVIEVSNGAQEPREYSGLTGEMVFLPGGPNPLPADAYTARAGRTAGERLLVEVADGLSIPFRWCPPGTFTMGSPQSEKDLVKASGVEERFLAGEVQHRVTLTRGFWLAETEVTQQQWAGVISGGSPMLQARKILQDDTEIDFKGDGRMMTGRDFYKLSKDADPSPLVKVQFGQAAMYYINHKDATGWCETAGQRAGWRGWAMTLPTEAQWEYACRAGTTGMTYAGDFTIKGLCNAPELNAIAWYGGNCSVGFERGTGWDLNAIKERQYPGDTGAMHDAGTKKPNAWGFYDMLGNVGEWTADWKGDYPNGEVTDPAGPATGTFRVVRGGTWKGPAQFCRAASRAVATPEERKTVIGFRPALVPLK